MARWADGGVDAEGTLGGETAQRPCQLTLSLQALPSLSYPIHFPDFQHIPVPYRQEDLSLGCFIESEVDGRFCTFGSLSANVGWPSFLKPFSGPFQDQV